MFEFYNLFFKEGYLKIEDLEQACKYKVISERQFKNITNKEYKQGA
ncbi:hypothetical protein [Clostridium rectalis]|nr:hypothetical protein [Clostridium rectalis]